ncbi:MAG: L-aspartate oxidase [Alphaproteobacteria bacterium]|nr:L-aspartate oxidase [Alphaproteobacteria bacterium]
MKAVVIGAGLGGLSAALALAPMPVVVVSPCELGAGCSSAWAQGGIAAAVGSGDKPEYQFKDTIAVGNGLNDEDIVRQTMDDGPSVIERLEKYGVPFDRDAQGNLSLGLEAAHSKNRIVHAKDATGLAIMMALIKAVRTTPTIEIIENARAIELVLNDGTIHGVILEKGGKEIRLNTPYVILATGGAVALWRDTTVPHENWGGGLALAAKAGATLGDLEFLQFHPTAFDIGRDPMPLASEALRGEGATLITESKERFIDELQARDVVARAIWEQMSQGHRVFLDARTALGTSFAERFPTIYAICKSAGIDPTTAPIPVRPAAHYHMGGIVTDKHGRTDVPGLWACGEVACTGLHGANRLASNSLLEAASFGWHVAEDIKGTPSHEAIEPLREKSNLVHIRDAARRLSPEEKAQRIASIRALMSDNVGVIRDAKGLKSISEELAPFAEVSDRALVGLMIAQSALKREESRGAHYRSDFPDSRAEAVHSRIRLSDLEHLT